ncbi:MAG: TIGR00268 family protein [Firmicutes bacterium HGW-Firmicutes-12]|jgi:uncharacterized protein|nr:MAG: TIGR00268 family protein [Firmicutes bacterium HGW-Firmicutes-12]
MGKYLKLQEILKEMGSVLVAYSGGVDSGLLLAVAIKVLGFDHVLAVTLSSEISTEQEINDAIKLAQQMQSPHLLLPANDLEQPDFISNTADRCYYCKKIRFELLKDLALLKELAFVIEGSNQDDLSDYRPGRRAAEELFIRSPLQEAGLTKAEIRKLAQKMNLTVWDKPSEPCLATRIPYGTTITKEILVTIAKAETVIKSILGHNQLRVRHHGEIARLEVPPSDFAQVLAPDTVKKINKELRNLGYIYVALDIRGYRQGSQNETLTIVRNQE